jgi:hypothetical protein
MRSLVRAEWIKFSSLRSSWTLLGFALVLNGVFVAFSLIHTPRGTELPAWRILREREEEQHARDEEHNAPDANQDVAVPDSGDKEEDGAEQEQDPSPEFATIMHSVAS